MQSAGVAVRDSVAPVPSAGDVRAELERLLSSEHFQASERRRAFLRYIVEETLAGRADRLKGYTIAVSIFGRDETFDPQADPVVRLEARRLRRDLDSYYVDAGSHDAVRISIPKGSYVPRFECHEALPPAAASGEEQTTRRVEAPEIGVSGERDAGAGLARASRRNLLIAAAVATVVTIAAVSWAVLAGKERFVSGSDERVPGVVVLPFEAIGATDNSRYLASGISAELIGNLMRFPGFRLYSLPASFEAEGRAEPGRLGRDLGVAYVVSGSVNANGKEVRVTAQMVDAGSGRVAWSQTYDRPLVPEALMRVQRDLAGDIATVIGQPYGVVSSDLDARLTTPVVSHMQSYVCVLRAYSYRRSFSRAEFDPVLACLQEAVRRDPDYSDAWAMLGWLHVDAGRIGYAGFNTQDEYRKALQASSEAVRLAPDSILALKVLASVYHYLGRYDDSERTVRQALEINSHDPEALAQLGWRLAVRGKFREGIPLLERAVSRTVNPPGWYLHLIAIDLYLKRDYERMLQIAMRSAVDGSGFSQLLIAVASGELGDRDATRAALQKLSASRSLAGDPAGYMRRHGATDEIVNALMNGLQKARRVAAASS